MFQHKFGNLTVISERIAVKKGKRNRFYRDCLCDCGVKTRVREDNLRSGNTQNCGCQSVIPSTVQGNLTARIKELEKENKQLRNEINRLTSGINV